jgi:hypothetical protein
MMEVSFCTVSEGDSLPVARVIDNALDVGVAAAQSSDHVLIVHVSIEVSCGTMVHDYSLCMYVCMHVVKSKHTRLKVAEHISGGAVVEHSWGTECSNMQIMEWEVVTATVIVGPELSCQ